MANYCILRAEKLKTFGNIGGSLSHTYRTRPTPNADPERAGQNRHTVGSADEVMERIRARLPEKRRKDAVLAIEYFIGCSPDAFPDDKAHMGYFRDALAWLKERHGADNVIASSLHFDETTPHLVAYVVPLDDQGKLNAKKFLGGRQTLSAMQTEFAKKVGEKHGLERGIERSTATHTTIKEWYGALNAAATPIEIPPAAVAPKVKQKRALLPDVIETPEDVAARLNKNLDRLLKPTMAKAKVSEIQQKKADEIRDLVTYTQRQLADAQERAKKAEEQAAGLRKLYESLTPSEQKNIVQQAKKNNRVRQRCQQIMSDVYDQAAAPVRRFVVKAKQALTRVAGKWWEVNWRDVEREYVDRERPISDEKTAIEVLLNHSPGLVNASRKEADAAIAAAQRNDERRKPQPVVKSAPRAPLAAPEPSGSSAWRQPRPKG